MTLDTLTMVYHSYFHSIVIYGIISWGNSSYSNSIFKLQQRIVIIIMGVRIRDSRIEFFKLWNILPLISHHLFSNLLFVVNNENKFQMNSEVHNINTGKNSDFYQPLSHLTVYQKGPFHVGIKVYNSLPPEIWDLSHNIKKFKSSLRRFLHQHSFYTLIEYSNYKAVLRYILTIKMIFIILSLVWNFEVYFHV